MKNFKKNSKYLIIGFFLFLVIFFPKFTHSSFGIPVGNFPTYSVLVGTDLYVVNVSSGNVSVVDTTTNVETETITVGTAPSEIISNGVDLYVLNDADDNVSVIDISTNTVTDTIAVGTDPATMILVGTDLYVLNTGSDNVSVIDTTTNTVTDTIVVDDGPAYVTQVGSNLYVNNLNTDVYSVIDTNTNTVADNFSMFFTTTSATLVGTDLYANGFLFSTSIYIIDTNTNTSSGSVNIGVRPHRSVLVGTDLYVISINSNVVKVIDTNTNTVTDTIAVGSSPSGFIVVGTDLYIANGGSNTVSVIDTVTNTVSSTITVEDSPNYFTLVDSFLYVTTGQSDTVSIIDTSDNTVIDAGPPILSTAEINGDTLTLTYDESLDTGSVSAIGDFVVNANAAPVDIESVSVVGATVVLTLVDYVLNGDVVDVSYVVPGSNMIQDLAGYDAGALTNEPVTNNTPNCGLIAVGNTPYFSTLVGTDLYVNNNTDGTVSVINTTTSIVTDTITVGNAPYNSFLVGTDLYVNNSGDGTVSVIDTNTNTVTDTITVGSTPYFSTLVDTDLYVSNNGENTVSVIDTNTNTVTDTITVGNAPYFSILIGTDLYVNNNSDGTVSVININNNTVTDTIVVGSNPYFATLVGTDLYVNNSGDGTVSVIDTNTNTVTDTITVGSSPFSSNLVSTYLYVNNSGSDTISIINTGNNTVISTVSVGSTPYFSTLADTDLYVNNFGGSDISVINTNTNLVTSTISVGSNPFYSTLVGTSLYVNNSGGSDVSVIDTITEATFVCGTTYHTLVYIAGTNGTLTGDTTQHVVANGTATSVTAVPNEGYEFTNWSDASTTNPRTDTNVTGNVSVTANFSQISNNSSYSSGSNILDIINNILDPILPDPVISSPTDVITPPVEPFMPEVPVIPNPTIQDEISTIPSFAPEVNTNENNNVNNSVPVVVLESIPLIDNITILIEDPVGKVVSQSIVFGGLFVGLVTTIFANFGSIADISLNLLRLWSLFLYGVGLKKRNRPWGVVYDSVTKQPLDPVYVALLDLNGKEIATSITDMDGRYGFLVDPGVYKIKVNKNNYIYPSTKLVGKNSDELYSDLYFGDILEVRQKGEVIAKNIPMDPIDFNWNEFAKKEQGKMKYYHTRDLLISRFSDTFSVIGFLVSFVILLVLPQPYNVIVFCLYLLLFALRRTKLIRNKKGNVVNDKSGIPLSYGILRVYSIATGVEVSHRVLDKKGNYYLLIANGNYMVALEKKNEDASYSRVFTSPKIEVKHGILKKKFRI